VLYCADPSVRARMRRQPFRFLLSRYRAYLALERVSFARGRKTRVLLLSDRQREEYGAVWDTPPERLALLPPTTSGSRRRPEYRRNGVRAAVRAELGVAETDQVWLAIGVQPRTKGFDRALEAIRVFPNARLLLIGLGEASTRGAAELAAHARRVGLASRLSFLGHREDIPDLMAASDLLVHPARHDTTGTVILEAVVNGLPVVTTAACGHARHVADAEAGVVIAEPFRIRALVAALRTAQDAALRSRWSEAAERYGAQLFLYEGHVRAAEIIVTAAAERRRGPAARRVIGLVARTERASSGSSR
jgi:UDP-glucose:(heptosyl)LPS alpha-1,3-glucosyltransferase